MRIEPSANQVRPSASNASSKPSTTTSGSAASQGSPLTSVDTQSIDGVLQLMTGASEIRQAVVTDIKMQIQAGEYLANKDVYDTASSILNL